MQNYRNIFLTGATGVLGAHLLRELLEFTDADIYCLVRAEDKTLGMERLQQFLAVYDPDGVMSAEFNARVHPVLGDVTSEYFGLTPTAWQELADRTDIMIHGAANTNLFALYQRIAPINVGGTKNAIKFGLAIPSKRFVYISTYTVMGDKTFDRDFTFRETDHDVGQGFAYLSYQQTKFEAEGFVRAAGAEGLNWKIMRPGQIFGESATGRYPRGQTNVSGLFYDIFKTIIESGVALYSDTIYDITPVDYVSRAIRFLALSEPQWHQTYHLTNPDAHTYTEVTRLLQSFGYKINIVPQDEYKAMLFGKQIRVDGAEYKSNTTKAFRWWYAKADYDFRWSCQTDCSWTTSLLVPRGIQCAKIDEALIGVYLETGIRESYFPRPPVVPAGSAEAVAY